MDLGGGWVWVDVGDIFLVSLNNSAALWMREANNEKG